MVEDPAGDVPAAVVIPDEPYPNGAGFGAAVVTLFVPFIALIVALAMRSSEQRPRRREFLKTWAIASGAWLLTGWIVGVIVFASISASGGECQGGIDRSVFPTFTSTDNVHWTATYQCLDGGTLTRPAKKGQVPS